MTEKSLNKLEPKKETFEKKYPNWQGIDKAEIGVTYKKDNGNLIKKGNKPL